VGGSRHTHVFSDVNRSGDGHRRLGFEFEEPAAVARVAHPLVLGAGRRLFPDGSPSSFELAAYVVTTPTGLVIASY
jgi:hypothetical protein